LAVALLGLHSHGVQGCVAETLRLLAQLLIRIAHALTPSRKRRREPQCFVSRTSNFRLETVMDIRVNADYRG
jgi:hypothetical protein